MVTKKLFECFGIEIETMIVDAKSYEVRPLADVLLRGMNGGGEWVEDFDDGTIGWSNELVNHVIEFKTNGPVASLAGVADAFRASAARANEWLAAHGARLLPGGMHPWMDPTKETQLWPHDTAPVYRAYDAMYDCHRHGWANLQSVHLNLPFDGEAEFGRLMAAVRLVLPLIPALAASSPWMEGRATSMLDNRLEVYRTNAARTPAMTGDVIPEPIYSIETYHTEVFGRIDAALRAMGADPVLFGAEWTNARGAIARFDRMAIEVRLIDAQECALADLAVAATVAELIRGFVDERYLPLKKAQAVPTQGLVELLKRTIQAGPKASLKGLDYGRCFGMGTEVETVGDLLGQIVPALFVTAPSFVEAPELIAPMQVILGHGPLATRLLAALPAGEQAVDREALREICRRLADCTANGEMFVA
jgi:glutamate---cysteine ligase / carboxylate-amine ligase